MSVLDDLELSVRAGNVLRAMKPDMTLEEFMALDRKTVMAQKNAGVRTWREVAEVQERLRQVQKRSRRSRTGGPAFPVFGRNALWELDCLASGMSLRDAAALAALPGLLQRAYLPPPMCDADAPDQFCAAAAVIAAQAYQVADAFIAARETKETD